MTRYHGKHRAPSRTRRPGSALLLATAIAAPAAGLGAPAAQATPGGGAVLTTPVTTATVARYVTVSANVRSGPGTGYTVVGSLAKGAKVSGTYTSNGWFKLGTGRYVSGSLLTSTPPSSTVTRYTTVTANVRSGPSTSHAVVGTAAKGTKLTGTMTSTGWLKVDSGRYVSGSVLTSTPPSTSPAPSPGTVTGAMVLNEAAKYAGIYYVYGGTTPAGFDCSGYTSYVFRQLGISLPRTAADQRRATAYTSNPRPGDLVFFGTYHVAIYAGNGYIWDSGKPGLPVQKRAIWSYADVTYGHVAGVSN